MKESQQRMMQHSEVKVRLLQLYLERYLNVLSASQYFGDIHLFDLFCGEGIYENGGKGSPIIFLETAKNIYYANKAKNKGGQFNCLFNDIEDSKIQKLKLSISSKNLHYSEMGTLDFSTVDYRDLLPTLTTKIKGLKNEKAFVFIDPYGYKDIKISDIRSLLQTKKSEVLLFLPTQFMFRFESKGTPECLIDFISELMPVQDWPASETGIDFIENLTSAFRKSLGSEYYVDSFIITRDKNQFFCLFFFTSHIYGFDRMLDAKWTIDAEEGRGWQFESDNLFSQVEKKPNTLRFERMLTDFLKTERSNGAIYQFTLSNGYLPAHSNEILMKYQVDGNLIATKKDGTPARKSSFYLNYKEYKGDPDKITLKIR